MGMEKSKQVSPLICVLVAGFLAQNLAIPVTSRTIDGTHDKKCSYCQDPYTGTPPTTGSHGSPPHYATSPPPPHHSSGGGSSHGTPPSHGSSGSPHHKTPTPSTPNCQPSTPSHGGGSHTPTPSGGSGSHHSPPITISPPSTPTPTDPGTPSTPSPPFTCDYWRNHPTLVWGLVGWFGTVGDALSVPSIPGFSSHINVLEALSNTRSDGFGALCREGTASLLNSMNSKSFPFTTSEVRQGFVHAIGSEKAAATQANVFKLANEGHFKLSA